MHPPVPDPESRAVLAELERVLRESPRNVPSICLLGAEARRRGFAAAADRAFERAVGILLDCIAARDVDNALAVENAIYQSFVKVVEDEAHYERCFARWREPLVALGRVLAPKLPPLAPGAANPRRFGFVFHAGVVAGHTEAFFRIVENCERARFEPRVYVLGASEPDFLARCEAAAIPVGCFPPQSQGGGPLNSLSRLATIRQTLARDATACAVWMSIPITVGFAFAMRLAPVQVLWSLRHHPMRLAEADGYITYGAWPEKERVFHGQAWTVCPVPLALDPRPQAPDAVRALRERFPERVLLGTLAREEKIDSRAFLECVAAILERHPECGYLWTGKSEHAGIAGFFRERGVGERCHFVGWVDTALHAAALDLFLECFPLGCGITGYQALAAGVPLLSHLDANTVFGMQYGADLALRAKPSGAVTRELLDEYPVLCARDPVEYIELASRLITDAAYREDWRRREAAFYAGELEAAPRCARRFFETLAAIGSARADLKGVA